jgi:hypothetical protein
LIFNRLLNISPLRMDVLKSRKGIDSTAEIASERAGPIDIDS